MTNNPNLPVEVTVACSPAKTDPPRILLADDDVDIRQICTKALVRSGYQVDTAEDGAAGWKAVQARPYDLLITDNQMPKVTGLELLRKVRAANLALPVIMATGTWPEEEFAQHPWLRPTAKLLKPYTMEELLTTVQAVLHPIT